LLELRHQVVVLDDLSRRGTAENLAWLEKQGPLTFARQDVRDARGVAELMAAHRDADVVLHLAGQVAVTTSVTDPRTDLRSTRSARSTCWRASAGAGASRSCSTPRPTRSTATWSRKASSCGTAATPTSTSLAG